ncbi:hypothetical protein CPAV1605_498 [seawater metagenome]|uniref:Uncharacterized protein n=1 Tax=seawater metagenome TaxID=1561972 RepID=A0A5E8CHB3_9ZZZZ
MDYVIIQRQNNKKPDKKNTFHDFPDRQYDKPLCGCTNYQEKLLNGDIIGIKFMTLRKHQIKLNYQIIDPKYKKEYQIPKIYAEYEHLEEHMFKILDIIDNRIRIEPFYFEKNKVLHHSTVFNFKSSFSIPKIYIKKEYLIEFYIDEYLNEFESSESELESETETESESLPLIKEFFVNITEWHIFRLKSFITKPEKTVYVSKKLPSYHKIYILPETYDSTIQYFELIRNNINLFEHYFGKEEVKRLGTLEQVISHNNMLYKKAMEYFDKDIDYKIESYLDFEAKMKKPFIIPEIEYIHYPDVYRVYKQDLDFNILISNTISNWSGRLLDEKVRKLIKKSDVVRIGIYHEKLNMAATIYFKLIHKLKNGKFLGILSHSSKTELYEDIILIIDTQAITEVAGYEDYILNNEEEYYFTGMGAMDWDYESIIPIDYNAII